MPTKNNDGYCVAFQLRGVVVDEITQIGGFTAYNGKEFKKFLVEKKFKKEYPRDSESFFNDNDNYLILQIEAKDFQQARENARAYFELFEYFAKFLLHRGTTYRDTTYDVGIFDYQPFEIQQGYVFKQGIQNDKQIEISTGSRGAFNLINIKEFSSDNEEYWGILFRYITEGNNTTDLENRLINAIRWTGIANCNHSKITQYVQYIFALESLLAYKEKKNKHKNKHKKSIVEQLSECASFIFEDNTNGISRHIKEIYHNRSEIVHGNEITINEQNISDVHELIYNIIDKFMHNEKIKNFYCIEELYNWIESKNTKE